MKSPLPVIHQHLRAWGQRTGRFGQENQIRMGMMI